MSDMTAQDWAFRIARLERWVRWHAWLTWALAGLLALTLVGVVLAWLPAWAAWELTKAQGQLRQVRDALLLPEPVFETEPLLAMSRHLGRQFVLATVFSAVSLLTLVGVVGWALATGEVSSPF